MLLDIIFIIIGLAILIAGAEGLVRGASSLAVKLRIPALVIGLTVVSFGTSAPELTINLISAFNGSPDLAVGNVVGSNTANILLILGVSALIIPLSVKSSTVWKEIPLALLGVILIFIMANDRVIDGVGFNALTRTDGIALLALMVIFMYYIFGLVMTDRKNQAFAERDEKIKVYTLPVSFGLTFVGLLGLIVGGRFLVTGAVDVAATAGLSEALIGLTVVAIGTSLPELATSAVAAFRRQADIAIGNVIGSNIFNVFFVLGATSVVLPLPITPQLNFDMIVSIMATLLLFVFMFGRRATGRTHQLVRWQGGLFIALYVAYMVFLVIRG